MADFEAIFKDQWCISKELYEEINRQITPGQTIVELGSGKGTNVLTSKYEVYSIENDAKWVGHAKQSHYIHAPLKPYQIKEFPHHKQWYDVEIVKNQLPKDYQLILIDGPMGCYGRGGFLEFFNLFDSKVTIIFDDVNRPDEVALAHKVSKLVGRPLRIIKAHKSFGVIDRAN
jgi:hypothetical protein